MSAPQRRAAGAAKSGAARQAPAQAAIAEQPESKDAAPASAPAPEPSGSDAASSASYGALAPSSSRDVVVVRAEDAEYKDVAAPGPRERDLQKEQGKQMKRAAEHLTREVSKVSSSGRSVVDDGWNPHVPRPAGAAPTRRLSPREQVNVEHTNLFDLCASLVQRATEMTLDKERLPGNLQMELRLLLEMLASIKELEPTSQDYVEYYFRGEKEEIERGATKKELWEWEGQQAKALRDTPLWKAYGQIRQWGPKCRIVMDDIRHSDSLANPGRKDFPFCCVAREPSVEPAQLQKLHQGAADLMGFKNDVAHVLEQFKNQHWSNPIPTLSHTLRTNSRASVVN